MLFFLLINVKMSTIVGILTFMSRKNFMLHGNSFITSGPGLIKSRFSDWFGACERLPLVRAGVARVVACDGEVNGVG